LRGNERKMFRREKHSSAPAKAGEGDHPQLALRAKGGGGGAGREAIKATLVA
jgi:hypothetical protein